jgi:uncharacterized BrkB/YihY/UPF0761 family membrane protein
MQRLSTLIFTIGILAALILVSGCSTFNAATAQRAADASDTALDTVVWTLCRATPVGAIQRRFRSEADQAAYRAICGDVP